MAEDRLYKLVRTGGKMLVDTLAAESDLLERLQRIHTGGDHRIRDVSVHVYEGGGVGGIYLGTLPASSVLFQGVVDEARLRGV